MTDWTAAFVRRARITDDPEGDLILDMRGRSDVPRLFENIEAVRDHLRWRRACPEAMAAVPGFWRRYRRWVDRHPFG